MVDHCRRMERLNSPKQPLRITTENETQSTGHLKSLIKALDNSLDAESRPADARGPEHQQLAECARSRARLRWLASSKVRFGKWKDEEHATHYWTLAFLFLRFVFEETVFFIFKSDIPSKPLSLPGVFFCL